MRKQRWMKTAALFLAVAAMALMPGLSSRAGTVIHAKRETKSAVSDLRTSSDSFYFAVSGMYTYSQLQSDIALLTQRYSGVSADSIGNTADGRQLYRIVIGNPAAEKKILVVAAMHAREYITTPLVMRQLKELLDRRDSGDTSLESVCVQFVPMLDPDGVAISQYALDGLQTNAMKQKVNAIIQSWAEWGLLEDTNKYNWYLNKWKNNANGVDLNRNFPTPGWAPLKDLRDKPASDLYKGPSGGSELETQAIMRLVQSQKFSEVVNYHSQGQIIYWAHSRAGAEVREREHDMGLIASRLTGYGLVTPGSGASEEGCSFKDWLDAEMNVPNITLEVGLGTAPVPETQLETIWTQNRKLLPELIAELLGRSTLLEEIKNEERAAKEHAEAGQSGSVQLNSAPAGKDSSVQLVAPRAE